MVHIIQRQESLQSPQSSRFAPFQDTNAFDIRDSDLNAGRVNKDNFSPKMSDLQKAWAKKKLELSGAEAFSELEEEEEEEENGCLPELPEGLDDDSSSASSASSTGTVVPTPSRKLFARPLGFVLSLAKSSRNM